MSKLHRFEAREWLSADEENVVVDGWGDEYHDRALVEDLYREGAVTVEVGIVLGKEEDHPEADALYVHLPEDRDKMLNVMLLLAYQQANEVDLVEGEKDVVRIWWD